MAAQTYYNKIIVLGRRGGPTYSEAQQDLSRLAAATRVQLAA